MKFPSYETGTGNTEPFVDRFVAAGSIKDTKSFFKWQLSIVFIIVPRIVVEFWGVEPKLMILNDQS
jgi:hypothetical protein